MSTEGQALPELFATKEEFDEAVAGMVRDLAPRLFAVVQEYGPRFDARIAGWGLAHETHSDVIGIGNSVHLGASRPEDMLRHFHRRHLVTARIVWPAPAAAPPPDVHGS
jgi:hypothetical protein